MKPLLVCIFVIVCAVDAYVIEAVVVQLGCVETMVSLNTVMFLFTTCSFISMIKKAFYFSWQCTETI